MDSGKKSLINVLLSVLAPVLILEKCSGSGGAWYDWGTVWALVVALSLPIGCGIYSVVSQRRVEPLAVFGLLGTLLTGVVSMYANSGAGEAIRPDTPWWYAGKELMVATMLAGAVLVTAMELVSGLVINRVLDLNVWDYSGLPYNFMGQVCLAYFFLWILVSWAAVVLEDGLRWGLFGEQRVRYRIF